MSVQPPPHRSPWESLPRYASHSRAPSPQVGPNAQASRKPTEPRQPRPAMLSPDARLRSQRGSSGLSASRRHAGAAPSALYGRGMGPAERTSPGDPTLPLGHCWATGRLAAGVRGNRGRRGIGERRGPARQQHLREGGQDRRDGLQAVGAWDAGGPRAPGPPARPGRDGRARRRGRRSWRPACAPGAWVSPRHWGAMSRAGRSWSICLGRLTSMRSGARALGGNAHRRSRRALARGRP